MSRLFLFVRDVVSDVFIIRRRWQCFFFFISWKCFPHEKKKHFGWLQFLQLIQQMILPWLSWNFVHFINELSMDVFIRATSEMVVKVCTKPAPNIENWKLSRFEWVWFAFYYFKKGFDEAFSSSFFPTSNKNQSILLFTLSWFSVVTLFFIRLDAIRFFFHSIGFSIQFS